jgi:glycosyltransferase involved in cell wall biosynthesis
VKILFVNKYHYLRSGTERYMYNLKRLLESRGHEVELFCMAHPQNLSATYGEYFVSNVDFHRARLSDTVRVLKRVIWDRAAARRISQVLDMFRPDRVHLFNIYHHLSPSILPPTGVRGIPMVQTVNDYKLICPNYLLYTQGEPCLRCRGGHFHNAILHRCLHGSFRWSTLAALEMMLHRTMAIYQRHVNLFVAPSMFVEAKLQEFGINSHKTRYLPYCINREWVDGLPDSNEPGGYVLYFGRLAREKGLARLIAAMSQLPDLELRIVGDGSFRGELEHQVQTLNLANVRFHRHCEGTDLRQLVARARLTVLPSEWYEVFGQSVLESLLCARPVVASRIGGIPEAMEDGAHGLLVPPGDVSTLAEAVKWLASHTRVADDMGRAGREATLQRFGSEEHYESLLSIYNQASLSAGQRRR